MINRLNLPLLLPPIGSPAATFPRRRAGFWSIDARRPTNLAHQPEYQKDIQRVLTEINALPPVERGWTLLYVHCGVFHDNDDLLFDPAMVTLPSNKSAPIIY